MINIYESIFICPGDITQEKIEATVEKTKGIIARANGKITSAELWGRRKLAYPIKHNRDGFYVYMLFSAPAETMSALDHHYRVTDTIIRGLTVKVDPRHLDKIKPAVKAVVPEGEAAAEMPAVAGTPAEAPAAESVKAPEDTSAAVPAPAVVPSVPEQ